jgi:hypothetical protein
MLHFMWLFRYRYSLSGHMQQSARPVNVIMSGLHRLNIPDLPRVDRDLSAIRPVQYD